jgi:phage N-6-adenine-methyltransferase
MSDEPLRDQWETPWAVVHELARRFAGGAFDLDAAADARNAKAPAFFTREQNALTRPWRTGGGLPAAVFVNPPYRRIGDWVDRAFLEVGTGNAWVVVLLVPPGTSTRWWWRCRRHAEIHEFMGRIRFIPPPGIAESGPRGDSVAIVIREPLDATALCARGESQP